MAQKFLGCDGFLRQQFSFCRALTLSVYPTQIGIVLQSRRSLFIRTSVYLVILLGKIFPGPAICVGDVPATLSKMVTLAERVNSAWLRS
jgi:hypothetical protein